MVVNDVEYLFECRGEIIIFCELMILLRQQYFVSLCCAI